MDESEGDNEGDEEDDEGDSADEANEVPILPYRRVESVGDASTGAALVPLYEAGPSSPNRRGVSRKRSYSTPAEGLR